MSDALVKQIEDRWKKIENKDAKQRNEDIKQFNKYRKKDETDLDKLQKSYNIKGNLDFETTDDAVRKTNKAKVAACLVKSRILNNNL